MADQMYYEDLSQEDVVRFISQDRYPTSFPAHWHRQIELLLYVPKEGISSPCQIMIQQKMHILHSGELLFIWPGELHEVVRNETGSVLCLQLPMALLTSSREFEECLNQLRLSRCLKLGDYHEFLQTMTRLLRQIEQLKLEETRFRETKSRILTYELFMALAGFMEEHREAAGAGKGKVMSQDTFRKIQETCGYLQSHFDQVLTLEQAAAQAGFSPCYFSRCFKQATGYHFVEYLTLQRIKQVQSLLTQEDISIAEAAFRSGFNSLSTFNRVFQKYNGCSPKEYKTYYQLG